MKKSFKPCFIFIAAAFSVHAFAGDKSGAQCAAELAQEAQSLPNFALLADQKGGIPALDTCKQVQGSFKTMDGQVQAVDQKVYITADKLAVIIQNNLARTLSLSSFDSPLVDIVVMAGRLITVTSDHRVVVVGRNGGKYEMLTSKGESYKFVKSVKMDKDTLVMEQEGNGPIPLTEEQVTKRLNTKNGYRAISF